MVRNVLLLFALVLLGFVLFKWLKMSPNEHRLVKEVITNPPSMEQTMRLSSKRESEIKAELERIQRGS